MTPVHVPPLRPYTGRLLVLAAYAATATHCTTSSPPSAPVPRSAAFVVLASGEANRVLADALEIAAATLAGEPTRFHVRRGIDLATSAGESPVNAVHQCGSDRACLGELASDWNVDELVIGRVIERDNQVAVQYLALQRGDGALRGQVQVAVESLTDLATTLSTHFAAVFGVEPLALASTPLDSQPLGSCRMVNGEARVRRAATLAWEPLVDGAALYAGDIVETAAGEVEISYASGASGTVAAHSLLVLEKSAEPGAAKEQVALRTGSFSGSGSGLVVRTAAGDPIALAARESGQPVEYRIGVRDGGALEVAVRKGEATLRAAGGKTVQLRAGQAQDVAAGALSGTVAQLPDFPRLVSPGIDATVERYDGLEVDLSWAPVGAATAYRLQIASDQSFGRPSVDTRITIPPYSFVPQSEGTYHWRVASIAEDGRQGEYGFVRRLYVVAEQIPDLLVAPPDGATIKFDGHAVRFVTFSWRAAVPPAPYRLVITRDAKLAEKPVLVIETTSQNVMTRKLEPGDYHWGVYVERDGRSRPIFRTPRHLTIND